MIAIVKLKNDNLYAYDAKNRQLFMRPAKDLTLMGYTASTVTVCSKATIYVYNEKGQQISTRPA